MRLKNNIQLGISALTQPLRQHIVGTSLRVSMPIVNICSSDRPSIFRKNMTNKSTTAQPFYFFSSLSNRKEKRSSCSNTQSLQCCLSKRSHLKEGFKSWQSVGEI